MGNFFLSLKDFKKKHTTIFITCGFLLVELLLFCLFLPPINVQYAAVFDKGLKSEATVAFVFDRDNDFPSSSVQKTFPVNSEAKIRVDPLNLQSQKIVIKGEGTPSLEKFTASVGINGRTLYTIKHIDASAFSFRQSEGIGEYSLNRSNTNSLYRSLSFYSETKFALMIVATIFYLLLLLRYSILSNLDRKYFAVVAVVFLALLAYIGNLWVLKPQLVYAPSFGFSKTSAVDDDEAYKIEQSFEAKQDNMRSIELPISINPMILPADQSNPEYNKVYDKSGMFRNRYMITISDSNDRSVLYKGVITPDLVSSDGSHVTIPLNEPESKGNLYSIEIQKNDHNRSYLSILYGEKSDDDLGLTPLKILDKSDSIFPDQDKYLDFSVGYEGFPYRTALTLIILVFVVLLTINLNKNICKNEVFIKLTILSDYFCVILYALFQFFIYARYVAGFPDEDAHISYIAFLKRQGGFLPDFSQMGIYRFSNGILDFGNYEEFNRLGHPPLFYWIEKMFGGLSLIGNSVDFSLTRLRLISFLIGMIGIGIIFYIGFTRIPKNPILHILFALAVVSPPNILYSISGVSNDSLALFSVSVFLIGAVRFVERKYNLTTYLIIATGISLTYLSKMTSAMMVSLIAAGFLIYGLWVERDPRKVVMNRSFCISLPIYVFPIAYFAWLVAKFKTLQPSFQKLDFSGYVHSNYYVDINHRLSMGVFEYIQYYATSFFNTWHTLAGTVYIPKPEYPLYSVDRVGVMLIIIAPVLLFFVKSSRRRAYALIAGISLFAVMVYQGISAFNGFHVNGYPGAFSSRYYNCAIGFFALIIVFLICTLFGTEHGECIPSQTVDSESCEFNISLLGTVVVLVLCILLIFNGFAGSVLYYADSIPGFIGS